VAAQSEGARQLPEVRREEPLLAAWDEVRAEPLEAPASAEAPLLAPARAPLPERAEARMGELEHLAERTAAARQEASADQMALDSLPERLLELVAPMEIQGGAAEKSDASVPHPELAVLALAQLDAAVPSKAAGVVAAAVRPE
jgi:hypothetical protein